MRNTERDEFEELISAWLVMRGQPVNAATLELWWVALEPWPILTVKVAVRKAMVDPEHGMYPPCPAQVTRHIPATQPPLHVKELPDIARGSGMAGILDHLESKQERNSRGREWIAKMRADLARRAGR